MPWDSTVFLDSFYRLTPQERGAVHVAIKFARAAMYREVETAPVLDKVCMIPDCGCNGYAHP